MDFQEQKQNQLSKKDKSSIRSWDKKIAELCRKINRKDNYCTTSSCSGRIVLIKGLNKKQKGVFLFRSHDKLKFFELKKELEKLTKEKFLIYFKQEPCILHVACKTLKDAFEIVKKAKESGWKRSGIMSHGKRIIVELHSTEIICFPIINKGKILVDDYFLKLLVKESNEKLKKVWTKIKILEEMF